MNIQTNRQLGKYQLQELLGKGAMAEIYKAYQPALERFVAIKIINPQLASDPDFINRFQHEAKIVANLHHPGIVQVYDFDHQDDTFYMVMQYVPGTNLQKYLQNLHRSGVTLPLDSAVNLFRQITQAVEYAHQAGVLHRDLKPANVLLDANQQPVLADFGLSRIIDADRIAAGAIVGTPTYMSPEQAAGDEGDARSDIYSLGIMLYEMVTGIPPFTADTPISIILKHLDEAPLPPKELKADLPTSLDWIIQKALAKEPSKRFQSASDMLEVLDETVLVKTSEESAPSVLDTDTRCPFRGLAYFDAEHANFYFGRERLVHQLIDTIARTITPESQHESAGSPSRFAAVLGASGSGKSSLVRAGLMPAVQKGLIPGSESWEIRIIRPGRTPAAELAQQLALTLNSAVEPESLASQLIVDGRALHWAVQQAWQNEPAERRLLLIIDQFEEIFTLCHNEQERWHFIENLLYAAAVSQGRTVVIIAMRADFYHRCTSYHDLIRRISTQQVLVGPMDTTELKRAIEKPAQMVGLQFEPGLVDTILDDVAHEPGGLPLLQHALLELWDNRRGQTLTMAAYKTTGGVADAIALRADSLYNELTAPEQTIVKRVMLRLTQPGEGTEDTRRRVRRQELFPINAAEPATLTEKVLQKLTNARLITTDRSLATSEEMVDVAHEALIRGWGRLRFWIDKNRADLHVHRQLTEAAIQWQQADRDASYLYQGARLAQAAEWVIANPTDINHLEKEFLESSQAAALSAEQEKEIARQRELTQAQMLAEEQRQRAEVQTRATRRLRWLVGGLVSVLLISGMIAVVAIQQWQRAQNQTEAARQAQAIAETERSRAEQGTQVALSRQLAAQANALLETQPDLAMLLGIKASQIITASNPNPILELELNPALFSMLHGHKELAEDVAFSPDGKTLASSAGDNSVILWDVASRSPRLPPLTGHKESVYTVAFSPDGQLLASGGRDGTIILWDPQTGSPLHPPILAATSPVMDLAFSPNGRVFASASEDGSIQLWDPSTSLPLGRPLTEHGSAVNSLAFSPDGKILASGGNDRTIRLRDASSGEPLGPPLAGHTQIINALAFSPDGKILASASHDNTIILWDTDTGQPLGDRLMGHDDIVSALAFSPDGKILASGGKDNTVLLWDTASGQLHSPPIHSLEWIHNLSFSPDGKTLAVAGDHLPILLLDVDAAVYLNGHSQWVNSVAFGPEGRYLLSGSDDNTAILWDVANEKAAFPPKRAHSEHVLAVAYSPTGDLMATASDDNTLQLWDPATGETRGPLIIAHDNWISSLDFSPDGQLLASSSADNTIRLWNTASGQPVGQPLTGHNDVVLKVVFSPDGKLLASSSGDETLRLWDVASGQPVGQPLTGHSGGIWSLAFSPDGKLLASGGNDDLVMFWDPATGEQVGQPLAGHNNDVWGLSFSPAGDVLASGGSDNTLIVWDVATGQPLGPPLIGHNNWIWGIDFSPDNHTLASGGRNGDIILWQVTREHPAERLCRIVNRNLTQAEWNLFLPDQPYSKICPDFPADPSLLKNARELARAGNTADALAQFAEVLKLDPTLSLDPAAEVQRQVSLGKIELAENLARSGDVEKAMAEYQQALALDSTLELDPELETRRQQATGLMTLGHQAAAEGDPVKAQALLEEALALNPDLLLDPQREANVIAADALVTQAAELAAAGELAEAGQKLRQAQQINPDLDFNPTQEARRLAAKAKVQEVSRLLLEEQVQPAIDTLDEARKLYPDIDIPLDTLIRVCKTGALNRQAAAVLPACEEAVKLAPYDGYAHDSRGLARALTGDFEGAIEDFYFFVQWFATDPDFSQLGLKRELWIQQLNNNSNPFTPEVLNHLKSE